MFQQTIQDVLALAEAGPREEDILACLCSVIRSTEPFDCGEIVSQTVSGLERFVLDPGLGDLGPAAMEALGDEPTLRIDTAAELKTRAPKSPSGIASILVLKLEARNVSRAVLVLGHRRSWSFAAAPLSRIRTAASVAVRLLLQPQSAAESAPGLITEVRRLRTKVATLEAEIAALRSQKLKQRS